MNEIELFPLVEVAGPPRERGRQYGRKARDRVRRSIALYGAAAGGDASKIRALAASFLPQIEAFDAAYLEEMQGIPEPRRDVHRSVSSRRNTGRSCTAGCAATWRALEAAGHRREQDWGWRNRRDFGWRQGSCRRLSVSNGVGRNQKFAVVWTAVGQRGASASGRAPPAVGKTRPPPASLFVTAAQERNKAGWPIDSRLLGSPGGRSERA
jgi:hypothetical protein